MNYPDFTKIVDSLGKEIVIVIGLIYGILIFATVLFQIWGKIKPEADLSELKTRTRSWWMMATVFVAAAVIHPVLSFVSIAFLSFVTLRELYSIFHLRKSDRAALFCAYAAIPIQYIIAYKGWYSLFVAFIPVVMFVVIPFVLVIVGDVKKIGRSMAVIPTSLMLGIFGISHLAYLLSLPDVKGMEVSGTGLLLFIVFVTEINDVMQFTWGKLFGKHKIVPRVSPNKTWEGFIGGVISTSLIAYGLQFLLPVGGWKALLIGLAVSVTGFVGDVLISAVKRDSGLKDTSSAIPGHGGILDRVDSLAVSAPIFFHLIYFFIY